MNNDNIEYEALGAGALGILPLAPLRCIRYNGGLAF
jgi:hypothetical protein